jgi:hypothetical protein
MMTSTMLAPCPVQIPQLLLQYSNHRLNEWRDKELKYELIVQITEQSMIWQGDGGHYACFSPCLPCHTGNNDE